MTNILAAIVITFATNSVEHWPQKPGPMVSNPHYAEWLQGKQRSQSYTLEYMEPMLPTWVDDTNADTKSVETTVTRRTELRLPEGWNPRECVLTNEVIQHFQVDFTRVRTNHFVNIPIGWIREINPDDMWFKEDKDRLMTIPNLKFEYVNESAKCVAFSHPTNWFEPVATNKLRLYGNAPTYWDYSATNTTVWTSGSLTNRSITFIETNISR